MRMTETPSGVWSTEHDAGWMGRNRIFYVIGSYLLWCRNILKAFRKGDGDD